MTSSDPELSQLRRLLLGHEIQRLEQNLASIAASASDDTQLDARIALLVQQASASQDSIRTLLSLEFPDAFSNAIRTRSHEIATLISPVIFPAIRSAIRTALEELTERIDTLVARLCTWESLTWRWEAYRTGVPFAQIVLARNLQFRVEHVFLLHRKSGTLLASVARPDAPQRDETTMAALLTALADFASDGFQENMQQLGFHQRTIVIEESQDISLALLVWGTAPHALREAATSLAGQLTISHGEMFLRFCGDLEPFEGLRTTLSSLLIERLRTPQRRVPFRPLALVLVLLALVGWGSWGWRQHIRTQQWDAFVEQMRETPGIAITEIRAGIDAPEIRGLRDALAVVPTPPAKVPVRLHWTPYVSTDPRIHSQRLHALLPPLDTVRFQPEPGRTTVSGIAPKAWIDALKTLTRWAPEAVAPSRLVCAEAHELVNADIALRSRIFLPDDVAGITQALRTHYSLAAALELPFVAVLQSSQVPPSQLRALGGAVEWRLFNENVPVAPKSLRHLVEKEAPNAVAIRIRWNKTALAARIAQGWGNEALQSLDSR